MGGVFKCTGCAECCKNLVTLQWSGLSLFPWEKHLFPSKKVHPHLAYGASPDSKDFRIFLYKYMEQSCEKLEGNKCTIYDNRPLVCRSYPFRYVQMSRGRVFYELAPECPGVKEVNEEYNVKRHYPEIYATEEIGLHLTHFETMKTHKWEYKTEARKWSPWTPTI
jgi:Fe-S-cluster containining protein